ncbi:prolyl oligopeptidase family serine peptidase [Cellulomonas sp. APG4]|uniref:alpha/beta hydrolase family protein n=1 Tax=Cellulomonas sp. APG4 TaxID=1538656 RepID=UPI00137A6AB6|nr:alpha/beta hydrolase [Cellulomonas sp. APG4]NCT89954.1 prolyl oligopeptidase family serine peptidase [Cellulomonas sp. APG4]
MAPRARRVVPALLALALVAGVAACTGEGAEGGPPGDGARAEVVVAEVEYRTGRAGRLQVPAGPDAVVVLVPGGSWRSADPAGMHVLADALGSAGLATLTVTYGTDGTGDHHPVPVQDLTCATAFAAARVPDVPVVLLGHSAGAHLAALAALAPDQGAACAAPAHDADAVVGFAGPYDVERVGPVAGALFDAPRSQEPELWADGNPLTWVSERPEVPFLLVHGEDDAVVPQALTDDFGAALHEAGHEVTVVTYPGVDHLQVIDPNVVADDVVRWVTGAVVDR